VTGSRVFSGMGSVGPTFLGCPFSFFVGILCCGSYPGSELVVSEYSRKMSRTNAPWG